MRSAMILLAGILLGCPDPMDAVSLDVGFNLRYEYII